MFRACNRTFVYAIVSEMQHAPMSSIDSNTEWRVSSGLPRTEIERLRCEQPHWQTKRLAGSRRMSIWQTRKEKEYEKHYHRQQHHYSTEPR
jgi:hypothetical protein